MRLLPTNNSIAIHHYSNSNDISARKISKKILYSIKQVYLAQNTDRRPHNDNDDAGRTDPNLTYRIAQLKNYIFQKHAYRIPLGWIVDLGLVNFAFKTNLRIIITLERNLNKFFESNKKVSTVPENPDAFINICDSPFISYQEINLTKNADLYFTGILRSETALRQGVLPAPYQQEFEIAVGTQSYTCTFKGTQRQFDWLEISVVYDRLYQHTIIYDSYDLELASKVIKSIKFENTTTTYSLTGKLSYGFEKDDDKNILYKMFIAKQCNGCSTAPLTQYKNNEIYQEITAEDEYTTNDTDDRIWIDMRRSKGYTDELEKINRDDSGLAVILGFREATAKKLRLRITGYSQGEYWYLLSNKGYIMSFKNYNISKADQA